MHKSLVGFASIGVSPKNKFIEYPFFKTIDKDIRLKSCICMEQKLMNVRVKNIVVNSTMRQ